MFYDGTLGSTSDSQEHESEATVDTRVPKLDSWMSGKPSCDHDIWIHDGISACSLDKMKAEI